MRKVEKQALQDYQMTALTTYKLFAADIAATQERIAQRPNIAREVEYYKEEIGNIKSLDDFMENRRVYTLVMQAYGLEDLAYARGFIKKLLEEGTDSDDAMANKLTDPRYLALAEDFDFKRYESATTSFDRTQSGVIEKFFAQSIENEAGNQNSGARLAIYFQRKMEDITDTYSILGDPALLKFVQTAFSLPNEMGFATIEKQAEMIDKRLDLDDLKDPKFVEKLVTQFLVTWDISNPDTVSIPPLISAPGGQFGLSQNLLNSILNLKTFNR